MSTARALIKSAMRKAGVLTKTEDPSSDEINDGLEMLNDLLASWSNDSMVVYARTLEDFTLTSASDYTIGPSGDFNTVRPVKIIAAYVRSGGIDYNLDIVNDTQYASIILKTVASIPQFLNYTNDYPLGIIKLYPVPIAGYSLFLLSEKPLLSLTLDQEVALPPGWGRALIYNLAMELSPEYGQPVTADIATIAREAKAEIRAAVMNAKSMDWDTQIGQSGNIYSGWYR